MPGRVMNILAKRAWRFGTLHEHCCEPVLLTRRVWGRSNQRTSKGPSESVGMATAGGVSTWLKRLPSWPVV